MKTIMNKVIRILILSDIALITGIGFVNPIFAIFITKQIQGGDIEVVGFAAAIYWIVESLVVIPFGRFMDKNHGEKDDFWFIIIGNFLAGLAVIGYIFAYLPWHIYCLEGLFALGLGMNIPAYTAIFTRHIDHGKEAFEWGTRTAFSGIGAGVAGALGGVVAAQFGFRALFISVALFIFSSALIPFLVRRRMMSKNRRVSRRTVLKDGFLDF